MWTMHDDIDWVELPTCVTERSGSPQYPSGPVRRDIFVAAPSTGWFPVSSDISGSHQYYLVSCHPRRLWSEWEVGEGNENLVYASPWDLKRSCTCRKILRYGTFGFTTHPKEGVRRIFIALKNPSLWPGSNMQPLGPVASTLKIHHQGDMSPVGKITFKDVSCLLHSGTCGTSVTQ
jgi:hypothetical protein